MIICLLFVGKILFISIVHSESWSVTKAQCVKYTKGIDTIAGYLGFLNRLVPENGDPIDGQLNKVINTCLRSSDGQKDIRVLRELIQQASEVHSVCEYEFIEKLLRFDEQIKKNASRSKYTWRKQKHRFSKFFGLFVSQVVLTCKKSLINKLRFAEENHEVATAIDRIFRLSSKNDQPIHETKIKNLSVVMRRLLRVIRHYEPNTVTKVENLVLFDVLKPSSDAVFSTHITINSADMLNELTKTKEACKVIDRYAHSSIYPITKLAWRGYLARNDVDTVDSSLRNDLRLKRWIRSLQYCQGVLIVEAKLDLDQEKLMILGNEASDDEQKVTVDLSRESQTIAAGKPVHRYEVVDRFNIFDADLKCYTYSDGLKGWLSKRLGAIERLMFKYIRVSILDESFKKSMFDEHIDTENEVQFAAASAGQVFNHAAHSELHNAQTGTVTSIAVAAIYFWILTMLTYICNKHVLKATK